MIAKHSLSLRLLHWVMAMMFVSLFAAGLTMVSSLEPWQPSLLALHKAFGLVALVLFVLRVWAKFSSTPVTKSSDASKLQKMAASSVHFLLYCFMCAVPLTGMMSQYFASKPISFFGIVSIGVKSEPNIVLYGLFRELHSLFIAVFASLILMHVAGALYHHFIKKDDKLKRML